MFLKGQQKDCTNPISYDKQAAPSHKICLQNFVETDIRGFGTKVGTYSNYSTIIEAMLPMFAGENQQRQRDELLMRKQLLREINGQEIDRIKGVEAKGPDKDEWLRYQPIDEDDDDATKAEKYYHNSLVIAKKPYFFRYLYPELNQKYKQYEAAYNEKSKALFKTKLKKLLVKPDKTEAENALVKRYHKFMPLINTNCTMNVLCREFESVDFDIQYAKTNVSMLPHYDINNYRFDPEIMKALRDMYRTWSNRKMSSYINTIYSDENDDEAREIRFLVVDAMRADLREKLDSFGLPTMDILTYIEALADSYAPRFNYAFAWDLLGDDLLECIEKKAVRVPVECPEEEGEVKYLGKYYKWATVEFPTETDDTVPGDPECMSEILEGVEEVLEDEK